MCEVPGAPLLNLVMGAGAIFLEQLSFRELVLMRAECSVPGPEASEQHGEDLSVAASQALCFSAVVMGSAEPSALADVFGNEVKHTFTI